MFMPFSARQICKTIKWNYFHDFKSVFFCIKKDKIVIDLTRRLLSKACCDKNATSSKWGLNEVKTNKVYQTIK